MSFFVRYLRLANDYAVMRSYDSFDSWVVYSSFYFFTGRYINYHNQWLSSKHPKFGHMSFADSAFYGWSSEGSRPMIHTLGGCEILHHHKDGWNPMNNGINHLSTGDLDFATIHSIIYHITSYWGLETPPVLNCDNYFAPRKKWNSSPWLKCQRRGEPRVRVHCGSVAVKTTPVGWIWVFHFLL